MEQKSTLPRGQLTADQMYEESLRNTTVALCIEKGWKVLLMCKDHGCKGRATFDVEALKGFPRSLTMAALAKAAVCTTCRKHGAWIDHRNDLAATHVGFRAWEERRE